MIASEVSVHNMKCSDCYQAIDSLESDHRIFKAAISNPLARSRE